ncbi:MAG: zinc-dependent metalloprotease [Bacteroidales bacterium]
MKNKILVVASFVLLSVCATEGGYAKDKVKSAKKQSIAASDTTSKVRLSEFDKIVNGSRKSDGFITIVRKGKSVYFEIPDSIIGRDLLLGCRVAAISNNKTISAGQMRSNPKLFYFKKEGKYLQMILPVSKNFLAKDDPFAPSFNNNNIVPVHRMFDIAASKDGKHLVDMTKYFTEEVAEVWPPDLSKKGKLETKIGGIKSTAAYDKNIEILTDYFYTGAREPFAVSMNYSVLLLSKEPMRERLSDERVGYMNDSKKVYRLNAPVETEKMISRFRLEPKASDIERFKRGELVEPAQPIIFYVDTVMPAIYRKYAKEGIEIWNDAFEKIGFKNAVRAYDFPSDPSFSATDITKNCLHYIATEQENASGPCWTDPRSGEIIQADILFYHSVLDLLKRWRFLQTAAADPAARKKEYSEEVMGALIKYAVSHEMGHCLGLQHNMRASFAYPVDSLRSPGFTQKYGTTASIMDYARNNHIAQPGDAERGVRMTPPDLGPFDYLAIAYGYKPIFEVTTPAEEKLQLNQIFETKGNDPMYKFSAMSISAIFPDPSAQSDALGNDLIYAGELGIKNLKYILSHLLEWQLGDDEGYDNIAELVDGIHKQYMRHLSLAASYIGGTYTNFGASGPKAEKFVDVDKQKQRDAVNFIIKHLRGTSAWANPVDIAKLIGDKSESLIKRQIDFMANLMSPIITSRISAKADNASAKAYTTNDYFSDLRRAIFMNSNAGKLNSYEIALQIAYIQGLKAAVKPVASVNKIESQSTADLITASAAMQALVDAKATVKSMMNSGSVNRGHYELLLEMMK